jgi:hypothetical protein
LTTSLGNDNSVGRLGRRLFLVGLAQSDTDTTSSRDDGSVLYFYLILLLIPHCFYLYLVVGNTRVLEGVKVQQVRRFRRELNVLTLNKERVVVLDDSPN